MSRFDKCDSSCYLSELFCSRAEGKCSDKEICRFLYTVTRLALPGKDHTCGWNGADDQPILTGTVWMIWIVITGCVLMVNTSYAENYITKTVG